MNRRLSGSRTCSVCVLMTAFACAGIGATAIQAAENVESTEKQPKTKRTMQIRVVGPDGKHVQGTKIHMAIWAEEPAKTNRDYVCDAQGQTTVDLPQNIEILRIWARADGYVPLFAQWWSKIQADGHLIPEEYTFELTKGTVIGGFVKNQEGQPIEGAKVEVMRRRAGPEEQRPCFGTWLAEGDSARITDAQGKWTLDNVPEGHQIEVLVKLSHPDYISDPDWGVMQGAAKITTATLRQQAGTIVMARGISVTGAVTDPVGQPVAGAVVVWGDDPYTMWGSQEVRTDKRGVYRFPPLPPATVAVTVMAEGWAPDLKRVTITKENPPVDFRLKTGKTLRLRFVDESGEPVPDVFVRIDGWRGAKSLYNHEHPNVLTTKIPVKADRRGMYEWKWAPHDKVYYGCGKEGYRSVEAAPYTADGQEHEVQLSR